MNEGKTLEINRILLALIVGWGVDCDRTLSDFFSMKKGLNVPTTQVKQHQESPIPLEGLIRYF